MSFNYVNYSNYNQIIKKKENKNNYNQYDDKTTNYYSKLREMKMDPILQESVEDNISFKYYNKWNAYSGEKLNEKDPYGPLCFHPDILIKYYYTNRLNELWIDELDDGINIYEGHYGDAIGAGENIFIQSRGNNPDKYLFRLPITDCYWLKNFSNYMVITMGPKLTDNEVKLIDELAVKCGDNYYEKFGEERPSLFKIKQLYDQAISNKPKTDDDISHLSTKEKEDYYFKLNIDAIDKLKKLRG
jgi:hypothetical protein